MDHWAEMRTALMLARLGTVTAAAEALGVHRATVNRHVETLENVFGAPLFLRHARGYTLTETGRDMLDVASRADEMFTDLAGRSRGRTGQLSGALVITALSGVAPLVMPAVKAFSADFPQITLEFITGAQLARLEHGEAHVAIRAGAKPDMPDYVVQPFQSIRFGLFASQAYIERTGRPGADGFDGHKFVGTFSIALPLTKWMAANVPPDAFALRASDQRVVYNAVCEGLGLGFLAAHEAEARPDLVEVIAPRDEWAAPLWIVTHVDLHRTAKVQEFLTRLKTARAGMPPQ